MIYAIDMDDTLMDTKNIGAGYRMGRPEHGAVMAVQELARQGHQIIIFTARAIQHPTVKKAIQDWCDYFQIPINGITNIKQPEFDVIIDNRALRYYDWTQVMSDLKKLESDINPQKYETDQRLFTDITQPYDQQ